MRVEYSKGERASKELILLNRQSFEATSGRKMKVMLIFPPDWFPSEPYLSLPSLTAVLRQAGHQVIQKDINLEMWDWYFSEDFLKKVLRRVPQQLDRLRKLAKKRELEEWEQDLQLTLCDLTRQRIDDLIKKAEKAKAIIRGEVFYEIDQLEWAIHVFREVTSVISMVYAPARICMPPMETDLSYKVFVSHEVMDAVNDTQVNVYRDVFEQLVKPAIEAEQPDVVGISIVLQQQMFSSMTFCALIKQHFPHIHVTIGGNTVTRLRDVLPQSPLFQYFDSAVVYEGETAFVQLVSAVGAKRSLADVPNTIYKDATGVHVSRRVSRKTCMRCRRRTSTACRSTSISCRPKFCPTWRRAVVTGAAASSATMAKGIRRDTGARRSRTFWARSRICATSTARSIFTSPTNPIRRRCSAS
jgi:anaerobic magnesium-protoporphyrin IX monomethyl ester cyclase